MILYESIWEREKKSGCGVINDCECAEKLGIPSLQIGNYFPLSRLIANQFLFCCLCFSVFFYLLSNLY
ncbi:hypothetical protein Lalb_Chr23g0265761 [Lupinus albus]|uniref:Uncharacterized protein n=1 Tax=Lupinus albus TaxID=3870 RepID=A0A6A4NJ29_LUPAL|nr:hypothetical protein Lalb_Chr23g0265761 [Lupinus albus]